MDKVVDAMKKIAYTGIGLAFMTGDAVRETARKIAKERDMSEEEGKRLVEEMTKRTEEARKNLEDRIDNRVRNYLDKIDVPKQSQIKSLNERIAELEVKVEALSKKENKE